MEDSAILESLVGGPALTRGTRFQTEENEIEQKARDLLNIFNLDRYRDVIAKSLPFGDQRRQPFPWLPTSNPERPFVRIKEDECDAEIDFDVPAVENFVDRMADCRDRAYDFFCDNVPGYAELPARLHDSLP